jgi:hypothetical protein
VGQFGEPFPKPLFRFFLRKRAVHPGLVKPALYLLQHLKMMLDVFQGTIVRQLAQQRLNVLLSGHVRPRVG